MSLIQLHWPREPSILIPPAQSASGSFAPRIHFPLCQEFERVGHKLSKQRNTGQQTCSTREVLSVAHPHLPQWLQ